MVDLGLSLKQARDPETQVIDFVVEPPVFHVTNFPTDSTIKAFTLSNATKTLLSAEIERLVNLVNFNFLKILFSEKIRRSEAVRSDRLEKANSSDKEFANPASVLLLCLPNLEPVSYSQIIFGCI